MVGGGLKFRCRWLCIHWTAYTPLGVVYTIRVLSNHDYPFPLYFLFLSLPVHVVGSLSSMTKPLCRGLPSVCRLLHQSGIRILGYCVTYLMALEVLKQHFVPRLIRR